MLDFTFYIYFATSNSDSLINKLIIYLAISTAELSLLKDYRG